MKCVHDFSGKPKGKNADGTSRRKWEDYIKVPLTYWNERPETEFTWFGLGTSGTLLNTVMNIAVPYYTVIFFASQE
jgi:hypothetical protein